MSLLAQLKQNTQPASTHLQDKEQTVNTLRELVKELDALRIFENRHAETDRAEHTTGLVASS